MAVVDIKNLDVVFGKNQARTLALIDQSLTRQEILDKTGDVVGVQDASLSVDEGEICVLMGLSGSGKSSLLRAVNGLNRVSRGSLEVQDGERMVNLADCDANTLRHLRSHRVSMVFQKFALMPWLDVLDNVAFGLEMQNVGKRERRRRGMEKLEMVGLAEWADKLPHELSGGMQQRVGLARAFAMDSDILLMDEPFSALDPLIRAQLQDELIELQKRMKKTILFVSHDLDEALKLGSHIAIMESARIIQHGKPEDIVLNPSTRYVEDFVAHTNPLNVLRGRSLMTAVSALQLEGDYLLLNPHERSRIRLDQGKPVAALRADKPLRILEWREGEPLDAIHEDCLVITCAEVSMRSAIELRYRSGQPVLLGEGERLIGILSDRDFYHALLGKHFTQEADSDAA